MAAEAIEEAGATTVAAGASSVVPMFTKILRVRTVLLGGFFVIGALILFAASPREPSLLGTLPDTPLALVMRHEVLARLAERVPSLGSGVPLKAITDVFDGPAALLISRDPPTIGLVVSGSSEELTQRARTYPALAETMQPLSRGFVAFSGDPHFADRTRSAGRTPFWNRLELAAALRHHAGFIRLREAPSDLGAMTMTTTRLRIMLPKNLGIDHEAATVFTDSIEELRRLEAGIKAPEHAPLRLPDGTVFEELRLGVPDPTPSAEPAFLICIEARPDICF